MPNTWVNDDVFWHLEVPDDAPTFDRQWDRMRLDCERRLGKSAPEDVKRPLIERQFAIVAGCMVRARELHASGSVAEAWGYLSQAIEILAFNDGKDFTALLVEISEQERKDAAHYGRQGAKKRAESARERKQRIVDSLLAAHASQPFLSKRALLDAAAKYAPGGGIDGNDDAWAKRLMKQPALAEIYASFGKARKRQQ